MALSVGIAFLVSQSSLADFNLQITSFLIIIYMLLQFIAPKIPFLSQNKMTLDLTLAITTIYLIVFSTGALSSPVFFLIYFLLFGIALLFEPYSALNLAIISTAFFLLTPTKDFWPELIQISSVFLIAPLAIIFGNQYLKLQEEELRVEKLKKEEKDLVSEIVFQEKTVKDWTWGDLRKRLVKIWENLELLIRNENLKESEKQKLTEISNQLSSLLKSAKNLEQKIAK